MPVPIAAPPNRHAFRSLVSGRKDVPMSDWHEDEGGDLWLYVTHAAGVMMMALAVVYAAAH